MAEIYTITNKITGDMKHPYGLSLISKKTE